MGAVAAWAVPAAISAISAYMGHKDAKSAEKDQKNLTQKQLEISGQALPWAKQFLNQSEQAISPALGYYTSMLANPREASAYEQNRINSLYQGQASNTRNMQPRGGYGPNAAENLRSQQRTATEGVIQQGRPMAAGALGSLGSNLAGLGFQGYGLGAGILGNVFNQGLQARQQQFSMGSALGNGLYNAYNSYLLNRATQPGNAQQQQLTTTGTPSWLNSGTMTPANSSPYNPYNGTTMPNSGSSGLGYGNGGGGPH